MSQGYASAGVAEGGFRQTVIFTSDGTFTKATYPWLKRVRVRVQAGGGGGGGAPTTDGTQISGGAGGGGGGYAESIVDASDLAASEAVTVGGGGAGGVGVAGAGGGDSIFDTISGQVKAFGGGPGTISAAALPANIGGAGGAGGLGDVGDLKIAGDLGTDVHPAGASNRMLPGYGGGCVLGAATGQGWTGGAVGGIAGKDFGGGGSGAGNTASQSTQTGGAGADGIVIVDLYG